MSLSVAASTVRQNLLFDNSQNGNRVPVYDLPYLYDLYVKYGKNLYVKYVKYGDMFTQKPAFWPLSPTRTNGYV